MKILKFNETANFSFYHTIKDEEILDLSLELTDMGFGIDINRKFADNEEVTYEPISKKCYPIYQIEFLKDYKEDDITYRYDGSYYYNDLNVLKAFTSVLSKMRKILPIEDAIYTMTSNKFSIRLIQKEIEIKELGFEFRIFEKEFSSLLSNMKYEMGVEVREHWSGGNSISVELLTHGDVKGNVSRDEMWKEFDIFDNKDQYGEILEKIVEFVNGYKKFIEIKFNYKKKDEITKKVNNGFFSKPITKVYEIYELSINIKKKK